ncbi:MAG: ATP synthase subunit I [Candidatus Marinimicrobia bacterium]|nr:ATP synthase subunit I [Candidatus Neomarinimicrobiota bacterium]
MKLNIINFAVTIIIIILVTVIFGSKYFIDVTLAGIVSLINAISGYFVFIKLSKKEFHKMMKWIFKSIIVRITFIILTTYLLIHFDVVKPIPFILILFVFYPLHQFIEIRYIKNWVK